MSGKLTYWQKLQDPRWQKKRLEILNRDRFKCKGCGATDKQLHVHHNYYISKRDPWEYPDSALKTLCWACHEEITTNFKEYPDVWEYLFALNDETDGVLVRPLDSRCHILGVNPIEFIRLLANALDRGVIDHETIATWRTSLSNWEKELEENGCESPYKDKP